MPRIVFDLVISAAEYQQYYSGAVRTVQVVSLDGRTVRFPANVLRHVIRHDGIRGRFAIETDEQGKFQRIIELARV
ncbi:DUF2835 domain-containing protein [Oceanobacter mangrovi]|uniref:DUF2835 domain-containing protein n=1 Tax=Oceanobacter mangrovi TaxID=2862510 RepID=UPI001C8DC3A2|nr:DUF2835 domain-containing protein [Oceanobacter mangrovi]